MTELLQLAISELQKLPDGQQNEVARMILEQIRPQNKISSLWQKIDELDTDPDKPDMAEITAMVKEVRRNQN